MIVIDPKKLFQQGVAAFKVRILSAMRQIGWVPLRDLKSFKARLKALQTNLEAMQKESQQQILENSDLRVRLKAHKVRIQAAEIAIKDAQQREQQLVENMQKEWQQRILENSDLRVRLKAHKVRIQAAEIAIKDAQQREKQLVQGMLRREIEAAWRISMSRESLGRLRMGRDARSTSLEEAAIQTEIERSSSSNPFDPMHTFHAIRSGRLATTALSPDTVVRDIAPAEFSTILARAPQEQQELLAFAETMHASVLDISMLQSEPDDAHDLVILAAGLETLADPAEVLRGANRILRPGGTLLIVGPYWDQEIVTTDAWLAPPTMIRALLPEMDWMRFFFLAPGGRIGLEALDPSILIEVRPALGKGAPLLIPPSMRAGGEARKPFARANVV